MPAFTTSTGRTEAPFVALRIELVESIKSKDESPEGESMKIERFEDIIALLWTRFLANNIYS
jgi:hypothetical protein